MFNNRIMRPTYPYMAKWSALQFVMRISNKIFRWEKRMWCIQLLPIITEIFLGVIDALEQNTTRTWFFICSQFILLHCILASVPNWNGQSRDFFIQMYRSIDYGNFFQSRKSRLPISILPDDLEEKRKHIIGLVLERFLLYL